MFLSANPNTEFLKSLKNLSPSIQQIQIRNYGLPNPLEKRSIGFLTRYRPIRLTRAQLKSFGNKTFFLVFPFGCAFFGQFKHVVFKIHHVLFSNSKSGILVDRILLEKGFLLFGALVEDMLVFSLDSLEKLISHSSLRDSGKHINKVYFHPHENK